MAAAAIFGASRDDDLETHGKNRTLPSMARGTVTGSTTGWRCWFLALTLCLFAFGYGAPTSVSAHARTTHVTMNGDCSEDGSHQAGDAAKPGAAMSGCCIAHCLPAMPTASLATAWPQAVARADASPRDEHGEGWPVAVLLPPPRA